jgi:hypothetical protein
MHLNRRKILKSAGGGLVAAVVASPAIAQSAPSLRWRLTTSFPKNLDTLYGACEMFSKAMAELSDQKFQIQVFGPGEIVPALQVFDAVSNGTIEIGKLGLLLLHRQGPRLRIRHGCSIRAQHATDERVVGLWRRARPAQRAAQALQYLLLAVRQHDRADGGLVPQGGQDAR